MPKKTESFDGAQRLLDIDYANRLIVNHEFPWCRARIFHALAAAHEQGKLMEVLHELLDDTYSGLIDEVFEKAINEALGRWYAGKATP